MDAPRLRRFQDSRCILNHLANYSMSKQILMHMRSLMYLGQSERDRLAPLHLHRQLCTYETSSTTAYHLSGYVIKIIENALKYKITGVI